MPRCSLQAKEKESRAEADSRAPPEEAEPEVPDSGTAATAPINRSVTEMWAMLQSEGRTSQSGVRACILVAERPSVWLSGRTCFHCREGV